MDLLNQGRVGKIDELAKAILADSIRRHQRDAPDGPPDATAAAGFLRLSTNERQRYSPIRAAMLSHSAYFGRAEPCPERDYHEELARAFKQAGQALPPGQILIPNDVWSRAMDTSPGSKGGYLTSSDMGEWVGPNLPVNLMQRFNVRVIPVAPAAAVIYPKQTSAQGSTWMVPSGTAPAADFSLEQLSSTPRTNVVLTQGSEQLLTQLVPGSDADRRFLQTAEIAQQAAFADVLINGTGGEQALGILNCPGVTTASGASFSLAKAVAMQVAVSESNLGVSRQSVGYAGSPTTAGVVKGKQRFASSDTPLWQGLIADGTIEGAPAVACKQVPVGTLIFGDWSQVALIQYGPRSLSIDPHHDFNKALAAIRLFAMVDVLVLEPKAFAISTAVS